MHVCGVREQRGSVRTNERTKNYNIYFVDEFCAIFSGERESLASTLALDICVRVNVRMGR